MFEYCLKLDAMINLPRQLIYQDRKSVNEYVNKNRLNDAFYVVLFHKFSKYSSVKDDEIRTKLIDNQVLDIFNRAYYLCVLANVDKDAHLYIADYHNYDNDCDAYAMALAILSLQRNPSLNIAHVLQCYGNDIIAPYSEVVRNLRAEGCFFDMDLSVHLPALEELDINWDTATKSFTREAIEKIVGLGANYEEKHDLCQRIWDAFQQSSSYGQSNAKVNDRFFKELRERLYHCKLMESAPVVAPVKKQEQLPASDEHYWVRKVVEYAKKRANWQEARPFFDMLNQLLRGETDAELFTMLDELEAHFNQKQKRKNAPKYLFGSDVANSCQAKEFRKLLKKEGYNNEEVDTSAKHLVNLYFVACCRYWSNKGMIDKYPNTMACYNFLHDYCGLTFGVGIKSYTNQIGKYIKDMTDEDLGSKILLVQDHFRIK